MSSKPITIDLTAADLRDLVTPVLPHAARDQTLPILSSVLLEALDGKLIATATDRYRIGVQRSDISAPRALRAAVPTVAIRSILAIFKPTRNHNPDLRLTFRDDTLTVKALALDFGGIGDASGEMTYGLTPGTYPAVLGLVVAAIDSEAKADPIMLNPALLADFKAAQRNGDPIAIRSSGAGSHVLVLVGDDFIGLIAPVRTEAHGLEAGLPVWRDLLTKAPSESKAEKAVA